MRRRDRIARIEREIADFQERATDFLRRERQAEARVHELERLLPVQHDWERLRTAFGSVEQAIATPAVGALAGQWRGALEIPDFPVQEREGYLKPFPRGALLF